MKHPRVMLVSREHQRVLVLLEGVRATICLQHFTRQLTSVHREPKMVQLPACTSNQQAQYRHDTQVKREEKTPTHDAYKSFLVSLVIYASEKSSLCLFNYSKQYEILFHYNHVKRAL